MDAAQLGQVQQQIHQELTAVREQVSVQQQQLAVLQQLSQSLGVSAVTIRPLGSAPQPSRRTVELPTTGIPNFPPPLQL